MKDFLVMLRSLVMLVLLVVAFGFVCGVTYGTVEKVFVFGRDLIL